MQVYRDDALQTPRPQTAATAYPTAWVLIWRSNGSKPVTMWKPVAPAGYRALGTVIVSRPDQPKLEQALCIRGDLVEPSSSFEAPIWVHRPPELNQVRICLAIDFLQTARQQAVASMTVLPQQYSTSLALMCLHALVRHTRFWH